MSHTVKVAIYYNNELHEPNAKYIPNAELGEYTTTVLELLKDKIKGNSLTDLGAGAGKWTALLAPYFKEITAIEPNDKLRQHCSNLVNRLDLKNVRVVNDHMPQCIKNITSDTVILVESLYLVEDWSYCFKELLKNSNIQTIIICDGADRDNLADDGWRTPFVIENARLPLLSGDELKMMQLAQDQNWSVKLYSVLSDWILIAERK